LPDIAFPELFDSEQIGESSLDDAMPWDMINPAVYDEANDIQPLLGELQARHNARVEDNIDFEYFRSWAAKAKERSQRTHVSLNEATRKQEKADDDAWELALENSLRGAKGKELAKDLDHLEDLREAEREAKEAEKTAKEEARKEAAGQIADATPAAQLPEEIEPVEDDALLEEAGRILMDLIGLSVQMAQLEAVPNPISSTAQIPASQQARNETDG